MKVEHKGHTTIIKDTQGEVQSFLQKLTAEHHSFAGQNLILDLTHDKNLTLNDVITFADLSKTHRKGKKSLVIAVENIDFNKVPAKLIAVPSVQEAHDIIEMEEIERDLGF